MMNNDHIFKYCVTIYLSVNVLKCIDLEVHLDLNGIFICI